MAKPMYEWRLIQNTLFYGYFIVICFWALKLFDNSGGIIHRIFWYSTMLTSGLALMVLIFSFIAFYAYGSRD
jgi:hypothetical protein